MEGVSTNVSYFPGYGWRIVLFAGEEETCVYFGDRKGAALLLLGDGVPKKEVDRVLQKSPYLTTKTVGGLAT